MEKRSASVRLLRFGACSLDLRTGELIKNGERIRLPEQPFRVLSLLLERPGEVVTREELRRRLWPANTFVDFDHGLNEAIRRLRDVLDDSPESPRYIETLPKRGYRFIGPVETRAARSHGLSSWKMAFYGAVAVVVITTAYLGWRRLSPWAEPRDRRIMLAVLPFENLAADPAQDFLSDGLTEELIAQLGRLNPRRLRVIARTSAMQYKQTGKGIAEIGRALGVEFIVEGSVRQQGERLRITVKLVQVSDQAQLWSANYDREIRDILQVQNEVARAVAREVRVELPLQTTDRLAMTRAVHPEAYQAYLKGRYYANFARPWATRRAVEYFQQAVETDPTFARAYAALGRTVTYRRPSKENMPKAKAAALQALALDPTLAEAHTVLGMVRAFWLWDWLGAETSFQKSIALDPADATAHFEYARYLTALGRFDEAVAECKLALALDPVSRTIATELGRIFHRARRQDEAIEAYRQAIEIDQHNHYPHLFMGFAYEQKGMYAKAREKFDRAAAIVGKNSFAAVLAQGYAAGGYRGSREASIRLQRILIPQGKSGPHALAFSYAALGRTNEALDMLEKSYDEREPGLAFLNVDPAVDSIRNHPRFLALLQRMNFPPQAYAGQRQQMPFP